MPQLLSIQQSLDLGREHLRAGRIPQAEEICLQILKVQPGNPHALHLLGMVALRGGQANMAAELIRRAIAADRTEPLFHSDMGQVLAMMGRLDDSIAAIKQALALRPEFVPAWSNLGNAMQMAGRLDEAVAAYRQAIRLQSNFADAYTNLGVALRAMGQLDEAITAYGQAVALAPHDALGHYNLGLAFLLKGDYPQGWIHHEWRWGVPELGLVRQVFSQPEWKGTDLGGRTIYLQPEQGFGDTIQFARYVPLLAERGAKVLLGCPAELKRLMKSLAPGVTLLGDGDAVPHFDAHAPLMSLPRWFNTTVLAVPAQVPYLRVDEEISTRWRNRVSGDALKVGLCWAGLPSHRNDRNRSLPPLTLARLANVQGAAFFSLQKSLASDQGLSITDWTGELNDFADTAALIEQLDLVISVDTAVAHLAGALGKQVWMLLPFMPDWRWMLGRNDSPWYPTMRLFRQPKAGDWDTPIQSLAEALKTAVSGK